MTEIHVIEIKPIVKPFYVYVHKYASGPKEGQVFYVGKGKNWRYSGKANRNIHWHHVVNKYGFTPKIVMRFYSEICAFSFEVALIKQLGKNNLCNILDGGAWVKGVSLAKSLGISMKGKHNPRYDNEIYNFIHAEHGDYSCTRYELQKKFNLSQASVSRVMSGQYGHSNGWHLQNSKPNFQKGENHPSFDPTLYNFVHPVHGYISTTKYNLCQTYSLSRTNLNKMIGGKYRHVGNWQIATATVV